MPWEEPSSNKGVALARSIGSYLAAAREYAPQAVDLNSSTIQGDVLRAYPGTMIAERRTSGELGALYRSAVLAIESMDRRDIATRLKRCLDDIHDDAKKGARIW